jgi:hypothetical protein
MQNVNINQEVENAMMAPPQQPRGIVDLLASELKARDAKARNQLNTMMAPAPDPNTIISQNEKETENNVRQEIMQKMQSMAVKENQNKARMNQALAGIAGQRANNMTRMANGGIVGYAGPDGSKVKAMAPQTPMAGQTQNPSPGYLDPEVATFLRELEKLNKQLEAAFPQEKDLFEQRITDLINTTSPRVKRIASDSQFGLPKKDGMAMGGIVGYATGGEIEAYLDSIGASAEYKANLTPEQTAAIGEMLDAQAAPEASRGIVERMAEVGRQMPGSNLGDRPTRDAVIEMLGSPVARGQNEVLSALPSGAMGLLQDRMSELGPVSQGAAGANEEATERRRTGIAETLQNAMPEEGIVGRMARVGRQMPGSNLGDRPVRDAMMEGIASLAPPRNPNTVSEFQQGLIDAGGANVTDQLNAAQRRINTTPAASAEPAYDPMKGVEAVADPNLRRAIEGAQAAPAPTGIAAPTAEQDDEVAATQLASTVASNPTPQNMSRFESEISRLMERRESPVRALSSFLKAFSQARGGSMGQNLAIATTAMNAADDAMDKQIIALEQLRRADQISERDFGLKKTQIENEKSYRDAMGAYYQNIPVVQKEIEELRQAGRTDEADRRLRESAVLYAMPMRAILNTRAKDELGRGATAEQIQDKANKLFEEEVETYIKVVQNSSGASPNSAVQEGATATNAQGDKVVFTNGAWAPM